MCNKELLKRRSSCLKLLKTIKIVRGVRTHVVLWWSKSFYVIHDKGRHKESSLLYCDTASFEVTM